MEDRRREDGVGATVTNRGDEVAGPAPPTRGDDGHRHTIGDRAEQLGVEAEPGAVTVDRRDRQLAGTEFGGASAHSMASSGVASRPPLT